MASQDAAKFGVKSRIACSSFSLAATRSYGESGGKRDLVIPSTVTGVGPVDPALLFLEIHPRDSLAKISNDVGGRLFNAAAKTRHNTKIHPSIHSSATKNTGKEGSEEGRKR